MYTQTAESVTEGHPDKIADQISDALLDAFLAQDPLAKVACETFVTTGLVLVGGEVTTKGYVELNEVVRDVVRSIGYTKAEYGFDADSCAILSTIHQQSPDIARGVETGGAGDQGVMVGYATDETAEYLPASLAFAHRLTRQLAKARKEGTLPYLRPDGKAQISVEYNNGQIHRIATVVISAQHDPEIELKQLTDDLTAHVIRPSLPDPLLDHDTVYHINPTGRFVTGGPQGDTGLTGRKIVVDTYGPLIAHGGGAFSGKDPSKVDRSGAYMARYIAKNIVAAGLAQTCTVKLAYAIGIADPIMLQIDTQGTGKRDDDRLSTIVQKLVDLTPRGIIERFNLLRPIYRQTAAYGHFGRTDIDLPWEKLNLVEILKKAA